MSKSVHIESPSAFRALIQDGFALSDYGLALFRIGLGLCIAVDRLISLYYFESLYSKSGVLPLEKMPDMIAALKQSLPTIPSIYLTMSGDAAFQILIGIELTLGLFLALGIGVRYIIWRLIYLICAFNSATFPILQQSQLILVWMCLAAVALPCCRVWSFQIGNGKQLAPSPLLGFLGVAFLAILSTATGDSWDDIGWSTGNAFKYMLQRSDLTTTLGRLVGDSIQPNALFTQSVRIFQIGGPLLLLLPFWRLRTVVCFLMLGLHFSYAALVHVGILFPLIICLWLALLPPQLFAWAGLQPQPNFPRPGSILSQTDSWDSFAAPLLAFCSITLIVGLLTIPRKVHDWSLLYPQVNQVRKFGMATQLRRVNFTTGYISWIRIFSPKPDNSKEEFDYLRRRWETTDLNSVPVSVYSEIYHDSKWRPVYALLARSGGEGMNVFWKNWQKAICKRVLESSSYNLIEAYLYLQKLSPDGRKDAPSVKQLYQVDCKNI